MLPEVRAGFTKSPAVVYSLIVLIVPLETNRYEPETAMFAAKFSEIKWEFTVPPEVVYSPMKPPPEKLFTTNRSEPETAMSATLGSPTLIKAGFTKSPAVVYSAIVLRLKFATNRSEAEAAMPVGELNPEIKAGFTKSPAEVYSATPLFVVTRIRSARAALLDSNPSRTANKPPNPCLYDMGNSFIEIFREVQIDYR
jgi:hypothetical protein